METTTLIALLALIVGASDTAMWQSTLMALVLVGSIYARQVLMPMINRARDAELAGEVGADRRFKCLHKTSVLINGAPWLAVLTALVLVLA